MRLELDLDFKERLAADSFFFGVAYAPYCEGGGLNDPDGFEEHRLDAPGTGRRRARASASGRTTPSTSSWPPRSG